MKALNLFTLRRCPKLELLLRWLTLVILASAPRTYPQTAPQITIQLSNGFARLNITGDIGSGCTVQTVSNLSQNWQFVTNLTLSTEREKKKPAQRPRFF